jgi:hypothetical protein
MDGNAPEKSLALLLVPRHQFLGMPINMKLHINAEGGHIDIKSFNRYITFKIALVPN